MYEIDDRVELTIADKDECIVVNKHFVEEEFLYTVIKVVDYNRMKKNPYYVPRVYNLKVGDLKYTLSFLRKKKIEKLLNDI